MSRESRRGTRRGAPVGPASKSRATSDRTGPGSSPAELTVRIDELAAGGSGVGRTADGLIVFVRQTAPGDVVKVLLEPRARPARGRVLEVLEPGSDRAPPPCPYFGRCGGCDWMHLTADARERGHAKIVRAALERALGAEKVPPVRSHPPARALGYRERARFAVRARRGAIEVGFRAASSHEIVAVDACLVLAPSLAPLLGEIATLLSGASGDGEVRAARGAGGAPVVDVAWRGSLGGSTFAMADAAVASGRWAGARIAIEGASHAAVFGDPRGVGTGADGEPLVFAPGGFSQTSSEGAAELARRAGELANARDRRVLELFAGSGTLSVVLARGAASLTAVELDAASATCLRDNLAARGLAAKVVVADADAWPIPRATDVVVLDPPRAGARGAAGEIAASRAKTVVYASCDPATLARDLAVITSGPFRLTDVETFELFPQTSHVETLVRLVRAP